MDSKIFIFDLWLWIAFDLRNEGPPETKWKRSTDKSVRLNRTVCNARDENLIAQSYNNSYNTNRAISCLERVPKHGNDNISRDISRFTITIFPLLLFYQKYSETYVRFVYEPRFSLTYALSHPDDISWLFSAPKTSCTRENILSNLLNFPRHSCSNTI